MAQPPKGGLARGQDKPIHGGCAIYFPVGVIGMYIKLTCFVLSSFRATLAIPVGFLFGRAGNRKPWGWIL